MASLRALLLAGCAALGAPAEALASGADFLSLEAGARASAMGGAFTAVADDSSAARWNPAGLRQLVRPEASLSQRSFFGDLRLYEFFGARRFGESWSGGLGLTYLDYGRIERVDRFAVGDGDPYGARDVLLTAAAARELPLEALPGRLSLGGAAKAIRREIERESANGWAFDAAAHYEQGRWRFGAALQNLGPAMGFVHETEALPLALRLGAAWEAHERVLLSADAAFPGAPASSLRAGAEALVARVQWTDLLLRAGFSLAEGVQRGASAGIGLAGFSWEVSYTWKAFGALGFGHWIGLSYRFRERSARETAKEFGRRRVSGMYDRLLRWYYSQMESGHMSRASAVRVLDRLIKRYEPIGVDVKEARQELERVKALPADLRDVTPVTEAELEVDVPSLEPLLERPPSR